MTRCPLVSLLFTAVTVFGTSGLVAEETEAFATDPAPTEKPPARQRSVSPETAKRLAAAVPKFTPLGPATAKLAELPPDLRETDKPRNTIIRLPPYIVEERKVSALKERDVLTSKGRLELALKRHPGLKFGPLAFLNNGVALFMLEEEERLERMAEANDLVSLLRIGNDPNYKQIKRGMDESFMRHDEE